MAFKPEFVCLHCAQTPDYSSKNSKFDSFDASDIDRWHREERNFRKIGYHWVVKRGGLIEKGRDEFEQGAHAVGFNHRSFGVCLIGTKIFTSQQVQSILKLYDYIFINHGIRWDKWAGHYEAQRNVTKTCPNISMVFIREMLRQHHMVKYDRKSSTSS